jgi:hypothetical protein
MATLFQSRHDKTIGRLDRLDEHGGERFQLRSMQQQKSYSIYRDKQTRLDMRQEWGWHGQAARKTNLSRYLEGSTCIIQTDPPLRSVLTCKHGMTRRVESMGINLVQRFLSSLYLRMRREGRQILSYSAEATDVWNCAKLLSARHRQYSEAYRRGIFKLRSARHSWLNVLLTYVGNCPHLLPPVSLFRSRWVRKFPLRRLLMCLRVQRKSNSHYKC